MSDMSDKSVLAVIGLGFMGSAIAIALRKLGHEVLVWNRTVIKCQAAVATGARQVDSPQDAIGSADLIISVLDSTSLTETMLRECPVSLGGKCVLSFTTASPAEARTLAAKATEKKASFLNGQLLFFPSQLETLTAASS